MGDGTFGSVAFACEDAGVVFIFPKHLYAPLFLVSAAAAVRAEGNQVRDAALMAFAPRNYVSLLKRQWIAANGAMMSRLEKNLAADLNWDCWAVVAHLGRLSTCAAYS